MTKQRRILFLDPIGHVLGSHDHAICEELGRLGCDVTLATNADYPFAAKAAGYRCSTPFRGVTGDGNRLMKVARYAGALARLARSARASNVDAVIHYYVMQPHLDGLFVRRLTRSGVRVVVCAHDVMPLDASERSRAAFARVYGGATKLMAFSQFARSELVSRFGRDPQSIGMAYLGVDSTPGAIRSLSDARTRLGLSPGDPMVLCFGVIKPNKSVDVLVRAFAEVVRRRPNARLCIVGRPSRVEMKPFIDLARDLTPPDRVLFKLARVAEDEVPLWYAAASVVVLPYLRLYQSAVVTQACALARPVVATRVGSLPELVRDGISGWLVPPSDVEALAEALDDALGDPPGAEARGARAQAELRVSCTWSAVADQMLGLIG